MAVRSFRQEVALIGYTEFRDPERHPRRADVRGDAAQPLEFAGRMCFDGATEVLTDQGWRRFASLARSERVATLNAETWNIEYDRPTDYFEYDCDEPLFVVDSPYVNLAVTGEHWLYVAGWGERGFRLRRTAEAAGRGLRFLRGGHWRGERPGKASTVGEISGPRVRLSGSGGGRAASPALGVRARNVPLAPFLAFLGRYLATGVCYAPPGGPGRVVLPQSPATLELAGACGFTARTRRGQVLVEDASLYDYLGDLGESHSKRIPRALLDLDAESLQILRGALFQGRRRFTTPSPQLAGDVQELLLKTGASGNCSQTRPGRYAVDTVDEWTPLVRRGPRLAAAPSGGRVWCVTVPNHIVYVRREGVPVWAGNCGRSRNGPLGRSARYVDDLHGHRQRAALEHGSATMAIRGVSRSLTHELLGHRHFSVSRLSERRARGTGMVMAGDIEECGLPGAACAASGAPAAAQATYAEAVRTPARRAARSILPDAVEAQFAVTGDLRAWAAFLKRGSGPAEPEIRRLALRIWPILHEVAPEVFDRFRCERTADGCEVLLGDVDFE